MMRRIAFLWDMPDELTRSQAIVGGMSIPVLLVGAILVGSFLVGLLA